MGRDVFGPCEPKCYGRRGRERNRRRRHQISSKIVVPAVDIRCKLSSALSSVTSSKYPMSQAVNIISSSNLSGSGKTDGSCIPCLKSSCGVVISPCSSGVNYKKLRTTSKKFASKEESFICKAHYNGHRTNPDFDQHNKQGFPRSNNWRNEETDGSENLDHPGLSAVTDGLMNSLASTSTPRFKVTQTPGPREKEIVELFRKIQIQLRERSTIKEQKRIESTQGKFQGNESVDSFIELLRKHSAEQGLRKINGNASSTLDMGNHSVQNGFPNGFKNTGFPKASNHASYESKKHIASSSTRSASYFRRSSSISRTKIVPPLTHCRWSTTDSKPYIRNKSVANPPEPALLQGTELVAGPQLDHEQESNPVFSHTDVFHDVSGEASVDEEQIEISDLSTLKLADLRQIARSSGVKGFSKLKKSELAELLSRISQ